MKILDKSGVDHTGLARCVVPRVQSGGRAVAPAVAATADSVRVSDVARALGKLIGGLDGEHPDPARAALVAMLRNAVAAGRYAPDLHGVARNLITEVAAEMAG